MTHIDELKEQADNEEELKRLVAEHFYKGEEIEGLEERKVTEEMEQKLNEMMDLREITIRLDEELSKDLETLSDSEDKSLQSYIREVLDDHVQSHS